MTTRDLTKRAAEAEAAAFQVIGGQLVLYQGCDETTEAAIARAGAEHWTGRIVVIRRFSKTAAECERERLAALATPEEGQGAP